MGKQIGYQSTNCWTRYSSVKDRTAMDALARDYLDFLSQCKTERETVAWAKKEADSRGFGADLDRDLLLFSVRSKALLLVRRGTRPLADGLRLITAHVDTPHLDLKQRPLHEEAQIGLLKTHYYGGIKKYHWLATPLALHGLIILQDGRAINVSIGEKEDDPVFTILDLLPHLSRQQREATVEKAFLGEKLNVVAGHEPASAEESSVRIQLLTLLEDAYGIQEEDLCSAELQIVPAGKARFVGLDRSLLGGYGQDDRLCVFAGLTAFFAAPTDGHTQALVLWDKEEIGSDGATGARSRLLENTVADLVEAWEPTTRVRHVLERSKGISADVGAPLDPDYQDVHDKYNAALLGHGPIFSKFTGHGGKYGASEADAEYVAWFRKILSAEAIPWQMAEMGRVDEGGGGTVAKELAVHGMDIIDFGPGVLSMHSPFELSSKADLWATVQAYSAFYRA